jgi:hypothetical protein
MKAMRWSQNQHLPYPCGYVPHLAFLQFSERPHHEILQHSFVINDGLFKAMGFTSCFTSRVALPILPICVEYIHRKLATQLPHYRRGYKPPINLKTKSKLVTLYAIWT